MLQKCNYDRKLIQGTQTGNQDRGDRIDSEGIIRKFCGVMETFYMTSGYGDYVTMPLITNITHLNLVHFM
jgi:hypothetical protein